MTVVETIASLRAWRAENAGRSIGFVPTMGALHRGHISLVQTSKRECDATAMSIFVNPTQFNDPKDLEKYPRPLTIDMQLAEQAGVDLLFLPQPNEMYSDGYRFQVSENKLAKILCGATRPGHFDGVLTVVAKLLNLVQPNRAYFGEKDYQQYLLIRDMAKALFMPVEIIGRPTVREADGLAMSSRNIRLTPEHRKVAPLMYEMLRSGQSVADIRARLETAGFRIDYLEEHFGRRFVAGFLGDVRLIDNV